MPEIIVPLAKIFGHVPKLDDRKMPNPHDLADLALEKQPANDLEAPTYLFVVWTFMALAISLP